MASHCTFLASRLSTHMAHGKEFDTTWLVFSLLSTINKAIAAVPNAHLLCTIS